MDSEPPPEPARAVRLFYVYGVIFLPLNRVVYIGSTTHLSQRSDEHSRLCGGARRIAIAFSQLVWQPLTNFFEFKELWRGECTLNESKAIEEVFMRKHQTRVNLRPSNGITKDIDLMHPDASPDQLNVNHACLDEALIAWAEQRVARDGAVIPHRTPLEQEHARYTLAAERMALQAVAESVAPIIARRVMARYVEMGDAVVNTTDVHSDLNLIFTNLKQDDGEFAKRCCRQKLHQFNTQLRR